MLFLYRQIIMKYVHSRLGDVSYAYGFMCIYLRLSKYRTLNIILCLQIKSHYFVIFYKIDVAHSVKTNRVRMFITDKQSKYAFRTCNYKRWSTWRRARGGMRASIYFHRQVSFSYLTCWWYIYFILLRNQQIFGHFSKHDFIHVKRLK